MMFWCTDLFPFNDDGPNIVCSIKNRLFRRTPKHMINDRCFVDYNDFQAYDMVYWGLHATEAAEREEPDSQSNY
jgi:hypothetical protein